MIIIVGELHSYLCNYYYLVISINQEGDEDQTEGVTCRRKRGKGNGIDLMSIDKKYA